MTDFAQVDPAAAESDLIFDFDASHVCQWQNAAARDSWGEQTGKSLYSIFTDYPSVLEEFGHVIGGQEFVYVESEDGYTWLIQSVRNGDTGFSGTIMTGSRRQEEALATRRVEGLFTIAQPSHLVTLSDVLAETLGASPDAAPFQEQFGVLEPGDRRQLENAISDLERGFRSFLSLELPVVLESRSLHWLSIRGQQAAPDRIVGSIEDVTRRRTPTEDRRKLELRMMRFQKMEAIGELAGGIAHDFNNILTSIMGYTELALMESLGTEQQGKLSTYLQEIYQGGRRARDLVAKMLTFSRSDQVDAQDLNLMAEVKDVVKMLRASLPSSIEIRIDIEDGLPAVHLDRSFLHQLIMNACINARDAMQETGCIFVRAQGRLVRGGHCASCHAEFEGDYVELSIEDTGPGIDPEVIERIFEPYVSTKMKGSGMGLAMIHGILHRQGGHVSVDTIVGDGTEFRFFLPCAADEGTFPEKPLDHVTPASSAAAEHHILVVDDEVSLVYFIRELLSRRGYRVTVASDSYEAWDLFTAAPQDFDLVVTDQTMPGLSGVQLAGRMLELRADLPIILCTGYSDLVDESNVSSYGIRGYMAKPIDSRELLNSIEKLLNPDPDS